MSRAFQPYVTDNHGTKTYLDEPPPAPTNAEVFAARVDTISAELARVADAAIAKSDNPREWSVETLDEIARLDGRLRALEHMRIVAGRVTSGWHEDPARTTAPATKGQRK